MRSSVPQSLWLSALSLGAGHCMMAMSQSLNYDLCCYLQRIQQAQWHNDDDTAVIVAQLVNLRQNLDHRATPAPQDLTDQGHGHKTAVSTVTGRDHCEVIRQAQSIMASPVAEPELPDNGLVDLVSAFYMERH